MRWRCGIPRSSIPASSRLLRKYNVSFVIADTAGKWIERDDVTADFVYIRLHGAVELYHSRYSEEELARFASRVDCWARGREPADARRIAKRAPNARSRDVYCYFDNTDKVHAPDNAIALARSCRLPDHLEAIRSESMRRSHAPRRVGYCPPFLTD